ncbi:hypothetical protein, partial [uncultured Paracoccus sp.]|uniref:hypothetical protein n=1 Tax=uncultured Paracoccus sp. TaxID=189685 RepID=UPI002629DE5C
ISARLMAQHDTPGNQWESYVRWRTLDHLPAVTYQTEEGVVMHRIISRPAEELRDASRSEAIQNLNDARGRAGYLLPVVASGAAVLGLLILIKSSIVPVVAVAVLTMIGCVIAHQLDTSRRNVVFSYQMDGTTEEVYRELVNSLDQLGRSDGLWYVDASGVVSTLTALKRNAGAGHLVSKSRTEISYCLPPGV